jgi:hypothetical protein
MTPNTEIICAACQSNAADLCPSCAQRREMLAELGGAWYALYLHREAHEQMRLRQLALEEEVRHE